MHQLHRHDALTAFTRHAAGVAGAEKDGGPATLHNSASAPTLYYGSSQRPLQVQAPHVLVERFSNPAPTPNKHRSASAQPPQHDSMSSPAQPRAPPEGAVWADMHQQHGLPAAPPQQGVAPAQPAAASQPSAKTFSRQQTPAQELVLDPETMLYTAGKLLLCGLQFIVSYQDLVVRNKIGIYPGCGAFLPSVEDLSSSTIIPRLVHCNSRGDISPLLVYKRWGILLLSIGWMGNACQVMAKVTVVL